jgi:hypothetical protein
MRNASIFLSFVCDGANMILPRLRLCAYPSGRVSILLSATDMRNRTGSQKIGSIDHSWVGANISRPDSLDTPFPSSGSEIDESKE